MVAVLLGASYPGGFYPGSRVEVLITTIAGSCWLRGTVTEPRRQPKHEGKVRVWMDQLPVGWKTQEIILPPSAVCPDLIQPINQPDREITLVQELADVFHYCAPVEVLAGLEYKEGLVTEPPKDESLVIGVILPGGIEKKFPYHPASIERVWREPKVSNLCRRAAA